MIFMKTSVNILLLAMLILCGCKMAENKDSTPDYEVYVNQIINSFAQEVQKEFGLICYGRGGSMPYDVEEISGSFIAYQKATIEEARKLEVDLTEKFLTAINSHEKIRPYLREYPFNRH